MDSLKRIYQFTYNSYIKKEDANVALFYTASFMGVIVTLFVMSIFHLIFMLVDIWPNKIIYIGIWTVIWGTHLILILKDKRIKEFVTKPKKLPKLYKIYTWGLFILSNSIFFGSIIFYAKSLS